MSVSDPVCAELDRIAGELEERAEQLGVQKVAGKWCAGLARRIRGQIALLKGEAVPGE